MQTSKILDVKWPLPAIYLESQQIVTYPNEPVKATVKYNEINCSPSDNVPVAIYILQLIYCGSSVTACYLQNNTYIQVNEQFFSCFFFSMLFFVLRFKIRFINITSAFINFIYIFRYYITKK